MNSRPDDTLAQLTAAGVAVWLDDISRERLSTGNLAALMRDFHVRGVTSNPTIFAHAISSGHGLRRAARRPGACAASAWTRRRGRSPPTTSAGPATCSGRSTTRPTAWTAGSRSRSTPGWPGTRPRPSPRPRALWWLVDRPNLFIKIPATAEGLPAITAVPVRGDQRQRHADLLAGALRARSSTRSWRAWRARAGARRVRRSRRWRRSSSAGWTPRWTSGWTSSARPRRRRCAARPRSPTRGWPTSCSSRGSPRARWSALQRARRPRAAAAVGLDQHQGPGLPRHHVRRGPGRAGHREHHAGGRRCARSPTTASCAATRSTGTYDESQADVRAAGGPRHQLRRRGGRAGGRGRARSSRPRGTSCSRRSRPRWRRQARQVSCAARRSAPSNRRQRRRTRMTNPLRDPRDRRIPRVAGPCVLVLFGVTGDLATQEAAARPSTTWPTAACCRPASRWSGSPGGTGRTRTSRR